MNGKNLLGALLAGGLCLAATTTVTDSFAQAKKGAPAAPAVAADPPVTKIAIKSPYTGITFGMSTSKVADAIDTMIDEDYKATYKVTSPGVKMRALDAQVAEDKATFRRSRIDFGKVPTGLDSTPLKPEYTYNNREAMMSITRQGETTEFFFIQDKLWKIIVERDLTDSSVFGKNYQDSVTKLSTAFGVPGRILTPSGDRSQLEVDWKDANIHLRVIQRSDKKGGYAYEDMGTLNSLSSLRTAKIVVDDGIDPSVAAIMRKEAPPDGPKDPKGKKK